MPTPPVFVPPPPLTPPAEMPPLTPPWTPPAGPAPAAPFGPATNAGTCTGCGKEVTWVGSTASAPKKCPHCGVRIDHVDNGDGTRTKLRGGPSDRSPFSDAAWAESPVWAVVVLVLTLLPVVVTGVAIVFAPRSKRRRAGRKTRRPPEADDADDAPPLRRRVRPRDDDDDIPTATLADAPDYEVVTAPPRRAKAKLLRPDGSPQ